jgi:hypothetical protein
MYSIELVKKGKDWLLQLGPALYGGLGKTVGLMLRMCKPIFHSGNLVILGSGLCILQSIIELKKVGVFAAALIKKQRFWPKYVTNGNAITSHFANKDMDTLMHCQVS